MADQSTEVTFQGNPISLTGKSVRTGEHGPIVTLWNTDLDTVELGGTSGTIVVLSVTPSVDTSVCDKQVREFNKRAAALPENVEVWNVSVDLPFALSRYQDEHELEDVTLLSDYKSREFGHSYGVYAEDLGLLARSAWIIDGEGVVRYKQIVSEMTDEPDYDELFAEIDKITG